MKIRVGIPSYSGKLAPETSAFVQKLSLYDDIDFETIIIPGQERCQARNFAVSKSCSHISQKFDFDYYLSLDNDNYGDVNTVLMLIDRNVDIVSAAYNIRNAQTGKLEPRFCAGIWQGETPGICPSSCYLSDEIRGLQEVDMVGLGFCLIRKEVFEGMCYPYFTLNAIYNEENGIDCGYLLGDDYSFCLRASSCSYKIYVDCDTIAGHNPGNEFR